MTETESFNKKMSKTRDATANFLSSPLKNVKAPFQAVVSVLSITAVKKRGNMIPKLKLSNRSTNADPIGGPLGMARPRKKAPSGGNWLRSSQYIQDKQTKTRTPWMYLSSIGLPSPFRFIILNIIGLTTANAMTRNKVISVSIAKPSAKVAELLETFAIKSRSPTISETKAEDKATRPIDEWFMPRSRKSLAIPEKDVMLSISSITSYSWKVRGRFLADLRLKSKKPTTIGKVTAATPVTLAFASALKILLTSILTPLRNQKIKNPNDPRHPATSILFFVTKISAMIEFSPDKVTRTFKSSPACNATSIFSAANTQVLKKKKRQTRRRRAHKHHRG